MADSLLETVWLVPCYDFDGILAVVDSALWSHPTLEPSHFGINTWLSKVQTVGYK